ncbi:MAG: 30S ribosome-binding factor RbfA [Patescibacteria group bacterium]
MQNRLDQVNDQIRDLLVGIMQRLYGIEYGLISVIKVKTSPDLRSAKVFVSTLRDKMDIAKFLNQEKKRIRYLLAEKLTIKYIPELHFVNDNTLQAAERVEELLRKVKPKPQ